MAKAKSTSFGIFHIGATVLVPQPRPILLLFRSILHPTPSVSPYKRRYVQYTISIQPSARQGHPRRAVLAMHRHPVAHVVRRWALSQPELAFQRPEGKNQPSQEPHLVAELGQVAWYLVDRSRGLQGRRSGSYGVEP